MPDTLSPRKSFVKPDETTMIVCPQCDSAKNISVAQFRHRNHVLKVRCKCGHSFRIQLEFRRHFRKNTDLSGTYDLQKPATGGGKLRIINLSLSGACFQIRGVHDLKIGQKGVVIFTLDNRKQTVLRKNVVIRNVKKNQIGCEFVSDRAFEKELGFYLLP